MPRVVVDTNLLVRMAMAGPAASPLYRLWRDGRFDLVLAPDLLDELAEVMQRPRVQRYLRAGAADALLTLLRAEAVLINPQVRITLCRDPQDDRLLEAAAAGLADYLVSSDLDLVADPGLREAMKARYGVRIVAPGEFASALEQDLA